MTRAQNRPVALVDIAQTATITIAIVKRKPVLTGGSYRLTRHVHTRRDSAANRSYDPRCFMHIHLSY